jgi:hypothetical protein
MNSLICGGQMTVETVPASLKDQILFKGDMIKNKGA